MKKSVAILGLGTFGKYLAEEFFESGADVLIADNNEESVSQLSDKAAYAMTADLSDPEAIKGLGIEHMDMVIVSMSQSLEPSIMCVMVAKELGVPFVIAKASNSRMADILKKIGADEVINIEEDAAFRNVKRLMSDDFLDYFDLGSDLCVVEIYPKPDWVGKTLRQLRLRERMNINVVARKDEELRSELIDPNEPLRAQDRLIVVAEKADISK
ncbi:MAG: TrkA family potassium uptake protein, partial [Oscillospiraceae bacterium]|nr:TrkA family potassium uptake protein [Oscillospiraceae bacterium]